MCLMVSQDVTERRRMEAQLAATTRLASLGTLVAGVAHEINNPLGAMLASEGFVAEEVNRMRADLRADAAPDPHDLARRLDGLADALADAQEGGRRVERIVKDLALFGRPDAQRRRVRLGTVVDEALRWLPASVATRAALRREDLGAPDVLASEGQLVQVVVNLVANAARAIPDGRRGDVAVRIGPGGPGMARLEVRDDGVGMTPELVDRIFDPFFTTREVGEGTGLGLAVVHSIVTAHGGNVIVASTPGQGTTVGVELPAAPTAAPSG
jgi:signal transduction histidine kinase